MNFVGGCPFREAGGACSLKGFRCGSRRRGDVCQEAYAEAARLQRVAACPRFRREGFTNWCAGRQCHAAYGDPWPAQCYAQRLPCRYAGTEARGGAREVGELVGVAG